MERKLIGPFSQVLTMADLPLKGAIADRQLQIIEQGAIYIEDDIIKAVGPFEELQKGVAANSQLIHPPTPSVAIPAFVDCHTHIAFAGNRAADFAMRNAGASYLEIAAAGGGILNTVHPTRDASIEELVDLIVQRAYFLLAQGIATIEVKSGYGLTVADELKLLKAIREAQKQLDVTLVPTCLAAHMKPADFEGSNKEYLQKMADELFPILKDEGLSKRIDAFIEKSAFSADEIQDYFQQAQAMGFDLVVHADQFTTSGSAVAVAFKAKSADHLEVSTAHEIALLAASDTVAVALPGASLGLGCAYTPARKLLDQGACLAIASDWNPGSAPMGQLLLQASVLAAHEKLSNAELFAALTFRAAHALDLADRGRLVAGALADFSIYKTNNYQNISYHQGSLQPTSVWKNGNLIYSKGE